MKQGKLNLALILLLCLSSFNSINAQNIPHFKVLYNNYPVSIKLLSINDELITYSDINGLIKFDINKINAFSDSYVKIEFENYKHTYRYSKDLFISEDINIKPLFVNGRYTLLELLEYIESVDGELTLFIHRNKQY